MQFERVMQLARDTPTSVLCDAWGASVEHVAGRKKGERPMTIREAGALADLHGLTLLDVLAL
jgi:hypothetical protein